VAVVVVVIVRFSGSGTDISAFTPLVERTLRERAADKSRSSVLGHCFSERPSQLVAVIAARRVSKDRSPCPRRELGSIFEESSFRISRCAECYLEQSDRAKCDRFSRLSGPASSFSEIDLRPRRGEAEVRKFRIEARRYGSGRARLSFRA